MSFKRLYRNEKICFGNSKWVWTLWIVQAPKGDISENKDLRFGRPLGSACPVRSGSLPQVHAAGERWPLASLALLWVRGWLWGQWCLSLRPCMAHVRPTFLLPTPHPGRTMPGFFYRPPRTVFFNGPANVNDGTILSAGSDSKVYISLATREKLKKASIKLE